MLGSLLPTAALPYNNCIDVSHCHIQLIHKYIFSHAQVKSSIKASER